MIVLLAIHLATSPCAPLLRRTAAVVSPPFDARLGWCLAPNLGLAMPPIERKREMRT